MSTAAASVIGALFALQASLLGVLAFSLSRTRERLARLEQHAADRNGLRT